MAAPDLNVFVETRRQYLQNIAVNLNDAYSLMVRLNSNLEVWAARTGKMEHLAQVWAAFQNTLASLSSAFRDIDEEKPDTQTTSGLVTGTEDIE